MKLLPAILTLSILGIVSPVAGAGQQGLGNELGQKARPVIGAQNAQPVGGNVIAAPITETMTYCQDAQSLGPVVSSFNSLAVLQGVLGSLGYHWDDAKNNFNAPPEVIAGVINSKVTITETPQHGTVSRSSPNSYNWQYTPVHGYVGTDKISFLVEYQGRRFKITVNLLVHESGPEGPDNLEDLQNYSPPCFEVFPPGSSN